MSTLRRDEHGPFFFDGSVNGGRYRRYLGTRNRREAERKKRDLDRLIWEDRTGLLAGSIHLSDSIQRYLEYSKTSKRTEHTAVKLRGVPISENRHGGPRCVLGKRCPLLRHIGVLRP